MTHVCILAYIGQWKLLVWKKIFCDNCNSFNSTYAWHVAEHVFCHYHKLSLLPSFPYSVWFVDILSEITTMLPLSYLFLGFIQHRLIVAGMYTSLNVHGIVFTMFCIGYACSCTIFYYTSQVDFSRTASEFQWWFILIWVNVLRNLGYWWMYFRSHPTG